MLALDLDQEQQAFADTVARLVERRAEQPAIDQVWELPAIWADLAELGVLGLATPEGGGGAVEIVAVMEQLGRGLVPGPLIGTVIGAQLLDSVDRDLVVAGEQVVTVAGPSLVPWGTLADLVIVIDDDDVAWLAQPASALVPVETMAGEPWARTTLHRSRPLGDATSAVALGDMALAAYLTGAGARVVEQAAAYARDRRQFGTPIGDFQAVAHPLARCHTELTGSRHLTMLAAAHHAHEPTVAQALAASARATASQAALHAAAVSHQVHGAIGFTVESGLGSASARIRQWTLLPTGSGSDTHTRGVVT